MGVGLKKVAPCSIGCLVPNFVASEWIEGVVPGNKIGKMGEEFGADSIAADFIEHVAKVEFEDGSWGIAV